MKQKPAYIVLAASGQSWQPHGPLAMEYPSMEDAEKAARELSARYPQRVLGVYELKSVFGTEQRIVKQNVDTRSEQPRRGAAGAGPVPNDLGIRMVN
jgi:hypothetical protein